MLSWIKASERLPSEKGSYFVRDIKDGRKIVCHFTPCYPNNLLIRNRWRMEWLEEK
jgi:hypothetical protein